MTGMKETLRELVGKNRLEKAYEILLSSQTLINDNEIYDEIIAQKARFEKYRQEIHAGLVDNRQSDISHNQVVRALLELIKTLPEEKTIEKRIENKGSFELILDEKIEKFNAAKKNDLVRVLSTMLEVPPAEVQVKQIKEKEGKLAITLQSVKAGPLMEIINSNSPQIEQIKKQFNIENTRRIKELAVWGFKKTVQSIYVALVILFIGVAALVAIVFFIVKYLELV